MFEQTIPARQLGSDQAGWQLRLPDAGWVVLASVAPCGPFTVSHLDEDGTIADTLTFDAGTEVGYVEDVHDTADPTEVDYTRFGLGEQVTIRPYLTGLALAHLADGGVVQVAVALLPGLVDQVELLSTFGEWGVLRDAHQADEFSSEGDDVYEVETDTDHVTVEADAQVSVRLPK